MQYTTFARIFPAIVTNVPLIILVHYLINEKGAKDLFEFLGSISFLKEFSLATVLIYFVALLQRNIAKKFEENIFLKRDGFPTTYFFTREDENAFSEELKLRYRQKITKDFGITLSASDEQRIETKKRYQEAAKQVILKVGKGKLVFKHNVWYGFIRNLVGGSVLGTLFALTNMALGKFYFVDNLMISTNIFLCVVYILILMFGRYLIIKCGEDYARQLVQEYLSKN